MAALSSSTTPSTTPLASILSKNFLAVSTPCLLTLIKYITNILTSPPSDTRPRTINLQNKTFASKIGSCKGGVELLFDLGFRRDPSFPSQVVLSPEFEDVRQLVTIRREVFSALVGECGCDAKESKIIENVVPYPRVGATSSSSNNPNPNPNHPNPNPKSFDPFKSQSFSSNNAASGVDPTSLLPERPSNYVSSTDAQLQLLTEKKRKLQKRSEGVGGEILRAKYCERAEP